MTVTGTTAAAVAAATTGTGLLLAPRLTNPRPPAAALSLPATHTPGRRYDHGCKGGGWLNAINYVIRNRGLVEEAAYPYTGVDGTCQPDLEHRPCVL